MKNRAFTLLEITVVISIIIILSTIFIANYRAGEKNFTLQRSAHQLAQDLRKVQEMAMAGQEFDETFPKGGYGIHFKEDYSSYYLFADCDGDGEFDETGDIFINCSEAVPENPCPETIEEIYLEENISIFSLSPVSGEGTLEITFLPPDPRVTINPLSSTASITLTNGQIEKTITINSVGLIDVQ